MGILVIVRSLDSNTQANVKTVYFSRDGLDNRFILDYHRILYKLKVKKHILVQGLFAQCLHMFVYVL